MSNSTTAGYVDIATKDDLEKYMYDGRKAITLFIKCVRKPTWFTQVPVTLSYDGGTADFGSDSFAVKVSKSADYLLHLWLRVRIPALVLVGAPGGSTMAWTPKLLHNLIQKCRITFNDLPVQEFDSYWLDFWSSFTIPESKWVGYNNMIGNVTDLTTAAATLPSLTLNLPLPFWFTRDSGVSLPAGGLTLNETRIVFQFRMWQELLTLAGGATTANVQAAAGGNPSLQQVQVWANYAVVSREERDQIGKCPRDILIEQVQCGSRRVFDPRVGINSYDVKFSHGIKALFWAARNITTPTVWSDYTTGTPIANDPIGLTSLLYEGTYRLFEMGSDYFSQIVPWYHFTRIPTETGYHAYSYSLHAESLNPEGSTNFGILTGVSMQMTPSPDGVTAATTGAQNIPAVPQTFQMIIEGFNWNIVRFVGGALGLPVL